MQRAAASLQQLYERTLLHHPRYMLLWICLSGAVIMLNRWILDPKLGGWPCPLCLAAIHQAFCSAAALLAVGSGLAAQPPTIGMPLFMRAILPTGLLFAVTLWLSNSAYVYLSVSFIHMLKAALPLAVYACGCVLGTEQTCARKAANVLVVVVAGVVVATYGEIHFVLIGVVMQVAAILSEAGRLVMVQLLLQGTDVKLTPMATMCYMSPVCFLALLGPALAVEVPKLLQSAGPTVWPAILLSASLAFALNISVLLLIGASSALTLNMAGIIKDVALVALSVGLYKSTVTWLQLAGYSASLLGVLYYNVTRQQAASSGQAKAASDKAGEEEEGARLLGPGEKQGIELPSAATPKASGRTHVAVQAFVVSDK